MAFHFLHLKSVSMCMKTLCKTSKNIVFVIFLFNMKCIFHSISYGHALRICSYPPSWLGKKKNNIEFLMHLKWVLGSNSMALYTNIQRANSKRIFCNRIYLKRLKPTQMMNTIQEVHWIRMNEWKKNSFQYFTK